MNADGLNNELLNTKLSNKLKINTNKTKIIIFRRPNGVVVSFTFDQSQHIEFILCVCSQWRYMLKTVCAKYENVCAKYVNPVFYAIVLSQCYLLYRGMGWFLLCSSFTSDKSS